MYLSVTQLAQSLRVLHESDLFFGSVFLALKGASIDAPEGPPEPLPIGTTQRTPLSRLLEAHLDRHHRPLPRFDGYYLPFRLPGRPSRWIGRQASLALLKRLMNETMADAFLHPRGTTLWGWRADYLEQLRVHRNGTPVPAFHLAVWLFRAQEWPPDVTPAFIRDQLFAAFRILPLEQAALFDDSVPALAGDWLSEQPVSEQALLQVTGQPPVPRAQPAPSQGNGAGGALRSLELSHIGPAARFLYEPGARLNMITGDNSLGKTFLLECIWWALTGCWLESEAWPRPDGGKKQPRLVFRIATAGSTEREVTSTFNWEHQRWHAVRPADAAPGLVLYARHNGSFAVWDPALALLAEGERGGALRGGGFSGQLLFQRDDIWNGLRLPGTSSREQWICNGLVRDWVSWQTGGARTARQLDLLKSCLTTLSPSQDEPLIPGEPIRLPLDAQLIPTLRMSYGDVPIVHASAGVQRVAALAYLLVWAWTEHVQNSTSIRKKPQQKLVLIIDEVEAHLHPIWQRVIVPSVMAVVAQLSSDVSVQVHLATHSPLVMASAETLFDEGSDTLHHLLRSGERVVLESQPFVKRGRADLWLMSETFGLKHARSIEAERTIEAAKVLQGQDSIDAQAIREVHARLVRYLAEGDDFWPRWRHFALRHGVDE